MIVVIIPCMEYQSFTDNCDLISRRISAQIGSNRILAERKYHSSPEILANGALNGAILENYVVSEIRKTYLNNAKECLMWYYRDKDAREIDMVIESDGELHPLEIKRSVNPSESLVKTFEVLDKGSFPRGSSVVICMRQDLSAVSSQNLIVPIWMI